MKKKEWILVPLDFLMRRKETPFDGIDRAEHEYMGLIFAIIKGGYPGLREWLLTNLCCCLVLLILCWLVLGENRSKNRAKRFQTNWLPGLEGEDDVQVWWLWLNDSFWWWDKSQAHQWDFRVSMTVATNWWVRPPLVLSAESNATLSWANDSMMASSSWFCCSSLDSVG